MGSAVPKHCDSICCVFLFSSKLIWPKFWIDLVLLPHITKVGSLLEGDSKTEAIKVPA